MAETINWLHLTDLHLGLDDQSWLWPRVKHDLFRDLEKIGSSIGGWDLVFFTGDFTQNGKKEEFDRLNKELDELWRVLTKAGRIPHLCKIPGNHDLVRPGNTAVCRAMTQLWWVDPGIRTQFWKEPNCEYRSAVKEYFANYSKWASQITIPSISQSEGILPGDFSANFLKGKINLGIVGLNSTFNQIAKGDFKGKLDLHVSQLQSVCGGDPDVWLNDKTISVLLTHQPPSWLAKETFDHYRQEIYPAGRFFAHFYGHEHESGAIEISEAGAPMRRLRQGPSIFGLENWEGVTPKKRSHGYVSSGAGNEFALIHHLINQSKTRAAKDEFKRATSLAIYYCRYLKSLERYRDLTIVAGALLPTVDRDECPIEWSQLAAITLEGKERKEALLEYEKKARKAGYTIAADTILFRLAEDLVSGVNRVDHFDKVLENKSSSYNIAVAIVSKAEDTQSAVPPAKLSDIDIMKLSGAYTYLHTQRFGDLFDRCHNALWQALENRGQTMQLLRLFRHTSFIWRIRGEDTKEQEYIQRLKSKDVEKEPSLVGGIVIEMGYFMKRLKVVIINVAGGQNA